MRIDHCIDEADLASKPGGTKMGDCVRDAGQEEERPYFSRSDAKPLVKKVREQSCRKEPAAEAIESEE